MSTSTDDITIQTLRDSLVDKHNLHEPWTSGVISLSEPEKTLFYETEDGVPRSLKLGLTNHDDVRNLSDVCQPATFGLNKEDVLDETYRKAGKLDGDRFAWRFNPSDKNNFANRLAAALFPWETLNSGIRFEPYKLNVYGQGSFFKTHKDTPRDENMFGSLVVVLPFKHEGGELLLRHRGRELVFNGQALIDDAPAASVAYVAFFSDVEHEVARVSSGYRVTVTYNLYFDSSRRAPSARISDDSKLEHPFKTELRRVMEDAVIRDAHPVLGFGLEHAYPFEAAIHRMDALKLKGIDAVLIKVFKELGIHYDFFLLYREDEENLYCPFRILTRNIIDGDEDYNENVVERIVDRGAWLVWQESPSEITPDVPIVFGEFRSIVTARPSIPSLEVEWVTEPSEEHLDGSPMLIYGNEVSIGYQYHQLCVIARFFPGPPLRK